MNLVKKEIDIEIEGDQYVMTFDMRSIATYKEITGASFVMGTNKLFKYDDEEIINFIASTLREKNNPKKPLGKRILEGDILYFLLNHSADVIDLIVSSLPDSTSKKKNNL